MSEQHPGRPVGPPPDAGGPGSGGAGASGPTGPTSSPGPAPSGGGTGPNRAGWIVLGILVVVALVAGAVLLIGGGDDEATGEVFLEAADSRGADPFASNLQGDAVAVTATSGSTTSSSASSSTTGAAVVTRGVSGARPGLYGGTRDAAVCDPQQQADFLAANPQQARAFVDALNADPTLRWSGGDQVTVAQLEAFLLELTPVTLTADTRVTNHGYRDGRPTARQTVLQAGTAVLVDAYGVPRVKCNCGNPLVRPRAVQGRPVYRGTPWDGFAPASVVVVTRVEVRIETYVLVDTTTGDPFGRPAGTTGDQDVDAEWPEDTSSSSTSTTGSTATTSPATSTSTATTATTGGAGDQAAFCARWTSLSEQYGSVDPSAPEVVAIFEELTELAPPDIRPQMVVLRDAVRAAVARGSTDISGEPGVEAALFALLGYLQNSCGISMGTP